MPDPIGSIKGVTADLAARFKGMGISNSEQLLAKCLKPVDRGELAAKLGLGAGALMEIANRADLARIKGVADVYADLLENAGVDTVKELAHRVPANLHNKLVEANTAHKATSRMPTPGMVKDWIEQAKALPPTLEY